MRSKNFTAFATGVIGSVCFALAGRLIADPKPLGIFNGVQPSTAPAVVDGLLTDQQRRDKIEAVWENANGNIANNPHGRWEDRTGIIVPATMPTTAPSAPDPLLASTLVTVHLKDLSIRNAITQFGKQTGIKLSLDQSQGQTRGRPFPKVTLDADNKPLLEVVNELCCKTGLAPMSSRQWGQPAAANSDPLHPRIVLTMQQPDDAMGPWQVTGPFAFEIQQISHSVMITKDAGSPGPVSIMLGVQNEPGIVVVGRAQMPTLVEAVDEGGHLLSVDAPMQPRQASRGLWANLFTSRAAKVDAASEVNWANANQPLSIYLTRPPDAGHTIARLRATEKFLVQTKSQTVEAEFSTATTAQEKDVDGMKCVIGPLSIMSPQQCTCQIQFKRGTRDQRKWRQLCAAIGSLKPVLVDDQGHVISNMQQNGNGVAGDVATITCYWWQQPDPETGAAPGKPVKLSVSVPTEMKVVEVPIQFDNLPLP